jgi:hypothetical protein
MKRALLLVFLPLTLGSILYAQNTGSRTADIDQSSGQNGAVPVFRNSRAQVTVVPGPQGAVVNSCFSSWPLGTTLEDCFSQVSQALASSGLDNVRQAGEGENVPASGVANGNLSSRSQSSVRPAAQTRAVSPAAFRQSSQQTVPPPVHYDRAGRRVVDTNRQDTLAQIACPELEKKAAGENPGEGTDARPQDRETVVVPYPAKWRIRGTLTAAKGMLALAGDDGVLWYLPGLERYIGFIDGLDAGEYAILEGYAPALGSSQERYFQPVMLLIDDMEYDLSMPPYGFAVQPCLTSPGGRTVIREAERPPAAGAVINQTPGTRANQTGTGRDNRDEAGQSSRKRDNAGPGSRNNSPAPPPAWQYTRKSPWSPPATVFDFEISGDSFWRDDPGKQEKRERDSREIWY